MLNGHGTEVAVMGGGEGVGHVLIIIIHHNDNNITHTADYGVRVYTRIYYNNNNNNIVGNSFGYISS